MKIEARSSAGADVYGVDLRQVDDAGLDALKAAFATYGLLIFHEQQLSEQDHIAVAERFGRININRFFESHPAHREIAMVRKEREQLQNIGGGWHTDHSYDADPALGSILVARELPETGGDTLFLNTSDAFDRLSPGFQEMLRGCALCTRRSISLAPRRPRRRRWTAIGWGMRRRQMASPMWFIPWWCAIP